MEPYSGLFKPYSDVLKPYSGVLKPYSGVLKPYSGIFMHFMELESLKLDFHVDFFPHQTHHLTNQNFKTRVLSWNSSFRHSRC